MPVGPSILWPENTRKSTSRALTSTGRCGTDWQASRSVRAPTSRASPTISATGLMVPRTFEACEKATILVEEVMTCRASSRRAAPSSSTGMKRSSAPVRAASSCHGIRLAWCSSSVTTMLSPGPTANRRAVSPPRPSEALDIA